MSTHNYLQKLYETHHKEGNRKNFSIYEKKRGEYFSNQIGTSKDVLDLGCRDGTLTKYFTKGNKVLGVDIDKQLLAVAKKNLKIQTKHMDLYEQWDFKKKFDAIVIGEVLEHLYHPENIIGKTTKFLKPQGKLLVSVPNAYIISARIRFLLGLEIPAHYDPTHINLFSAKKLKQMLYRHFEEVHVTGFAPPAYRSLLPLSTSLFADDLIAVASIPRKTIRSKT